MSSPKLSELAKKLVLEGILAGDSNHEIIGRLEALGVQAQLTPQALSYYRALPQVRAAVVMWERQAMQVGLARRSLRMQKLDAIATRLEFRLAPRGLESLSQPDNLDGRELAILDRYLRTLGMIQALAGPAERLDACVAEDVELAALQRRQVRDINPWFSAEAAIETADRLELDDQEGTVGCAVEEPVPVP